ncbi:MAG TPA: hypothetical protein VK864_09170, partial [Longimicrobiales bacterium]|nr:hypothetical protein [Longimicrobiales bacterium]
DQPKTITANASGGSMAAPVWADMMKAAYAKRSQQGSWSAPATLMSVTIDSESGLLATTNCPAEQVRVEYFIQGTQPGEYCPLHATGPERALKKLIEGIRRIF